MLSNHRRRPANPAIIATAHPSNYTRLRAGGRTTSDDRNRNDDDVVRLA